MMRWLMNLAADESDERLARQIEKRSLRARGPTSSQERRRGKSVGPLRCRLMAVCCGLVA